MGQDKRQAIGENSKAKSKRAVGDLIFKSKVGTNRKTFWVRKVKVEEVGGWACILAHIRTQGVGRMVFKFLENPRLGGVGCPKLFLGTG